MRLIQVVGLKDDQVGSVFAAFTGSEHVTGEVRFFHQGHAHWVVQGFWSGTKDSFEQFKKTLGLTGQGRVVSFCKEEG